VEILRERGERLGGGWRDGDEGDGERGRAMRAVVL